MSSDEDQQESSQCNYWLKLPRDITTMILQKVGFIDILISAQFVCTQWQDIYTDPSTWSTIRLVDWDFYWKRGIFSSKFKKRLVDMIRWAVDRSGGNLFDLDLDTFMSEKLLYYVVERCTQIRRLRVLRLCFIEDDGGLERVADRLPLLEHLELVDDYRCSGNLSSDMITALGRYCPRLSSLKICIYDDDEAKIIARNMPQLHHICLTGENLITDVGVEALFDGCPHLETLDIPKCYILEITSDSPTETERRNFPLTRTQWRDIFENPLTWSTICVFYLSLFERRKNYHQYVGDMLKRVVDKNCGGTVDLHLRMSISRDILHYIFERCTQIRRLVVWLNFAEEDLRGVVARLPLLEHFDLYGILSAETIETLGRCCPRLTSLKIPIPDDEIAKTMARSFPRLRHLKPIYAENVTEVGLEALLDGCPDLESLNLETCNHSLFNSPVWIRCTERIKDLKRPFGGIYHRYGCSCRCCWPINHQMELDDYDYSQFIEEEVDNQSFFEEDVNNPLFFEEDVYDVHYTIDRREEYWSRREKARGREIHIRQLRKEKGNKFRPNTCDTKRDQKDRRRGEFITDSRKEIKKEFVHWNKIMSGPYTLYETSI